MQSVAELIRKQNVKKAFERVGHCGTREKEQKEKETGKLLKL